MNRNTLRERPGGWLETPPLLLIRFVYEPVEGKGRVGTKRIRLDPGNIPIEEAIAAMPEAIRPAPPWDFQAWGRGIYTPRAANLVLGVLFGRKIAEGYGYDFNYTVLAQRHGEFTLSSSDVLRWLLEYLPERSCRVLLPRSGAGIDPEQLSARIERALINGQKELDLAGHTSKPPFAIDLHLTVSTQRQISDGKMRLSELPELAEGLALRLRENRSGQYFESR
ncbi:MAG: hypothetical protein RBT64_14045 [Trichloromonas sp.]|nr:hypothetical protein [Trichloromonas sp.]